MIRRTALALSDWLRGAALRGGPGQRDITDDPTSAGGYCSHEHYYLATTFEAFYLGPAV